MSTVNWDECRYIDGTINLTKAYQQYYDEEPGMVAMSYITEVTSIFDIRSRQLAAVILVNANDRENACE